MKLLLLKFLIFFTLTFCSLGSNTYHNQGWHLIPGDGSTAQNFLDRNPNVLLIWGYENSEWNVGLSKTVAETSTAYSSYPVIINLNKQLSYFVYLKHSSSLDTIDAEASEQIYYQDYFDASPRSWHLMRGDDSASQTVLANSPKLSAIWGYENGSWKVKYNGEMPVDYRGFPSLKKLESGRGYFVNNLDLPVPIIPKGSTNFGAISNGYVDIYQLKDNGSKVHLWSTKTSEGNTLNEMGKFDLHLSQLDDNAYYIYQLSGGDNWDLDNNGVKDGFPTKNLGSIRSLMLGKNIKSMGIKFSINFATELLYASIPFELYTISQLEQVLTNKSLSILHTDLNHDGLIDYLDLNYFRLQSHRFLLSEDIKNRLTIMVSSLQQGKGVPFNSLNIIKTVPTRGYAFDVVLRNRDNKLFVATDQGVDVFDVTNPTNVSRITEYNIPSARALLLNPGEYAIYVVNQNFDITRLDVNDLGNIYPTAIGWTEWPFDIPLTSNRLYSFVPDEDLGLEIYKMFFSPNGLDGELYSTIQTPGSANDTVLSADEKRVFLSDGNKGLLIVDVSDRLNLSVLGAVDTLGFANDVELSNDENKIFLADTLTGVNLIDVSNPNNPKVLETVSTKGNAQKLAKTTNDNFVFVADGDSGLTSIYMPTSKVLEVPLPDTPTNIEIRVDDSKITLNWDDNSNVKRYRVYYSTTKAAFQASEYIETENSTITIDKLANNQNYYFYIGPMDKLGRMGSVSNEIFGVPILKWKTPMYDIDLVKIPAGDFVMGSYIPPDYPNRFSIDAEIPQHMVTISKDFYIADAEVTQKLWTTIMPDHQFSDYDQPKQRWGLGDNYPIYSVSWNDITKVDGFLDRLNFNFGCDVSNLPTDKTRYNPSNVLGGCFRLPTEAEWEYMTRAGTTTPYFHNIQPIISEYPSFEIYTWSGLDETKPVREKLANPWGIYDVYGNVAEWTYDVYDSDYYTSADITDPTGPINGYGHSIRGGYFRDHVIHRQSGSRNRKDPDERWFGLGFRLLAVTETNDTKLIPPSTPENVSVFVKDSSLDITWDTVENASVYRIATIFDNLASEVQYDLTTNTHLTLNNLLNDKPYFIQVQALNLFGGISDPSHGILATPHLEAPPIPTTIAVSSEDKKILINWEDVFHADYYKVYSASDSIFKLNVSVEQTIQPYVSINGLDNNSNYFFKIESYNIKGSRGPSIIVSGTPLEHRTDPFFGIELVRIPFGSFEMGSSDSDLEANIIEKPLHDVTISKDFYVSKYELRQDQYNNIIDKAYLNPTTERSDSTPVSNLSYYDIVGQDGFLDVLNKTIGCDPDLIQRYPSYYFPDNVPENCFRLPTEAEWEYIARAGKKSRYFFGDQANDLNRYAWFDSTWSKQLVGKKWPNPWGIYDIYGNVHEFVFDKSTFDTTYARNNNLYNIYGNGVVIDPIYAPSSTRYSIIRGGGWSSKAEDLRSASRVNTYSNSSRSSNVGLRLLAVAPRDVKMLQTPLTPSNINAEIGDSSVKFTWDPVDNSVLYRIYFNEPTLSGVKGSMIQTSLPYIFFNDLVNGVNYVTRFSSINLFGGESPKSDEVHSIPELKKPTSPIEIHYSTDKDKISLYWHPMFHAESYKVYSSTNSSIETSLGFKETDTNSITIADLEPQSTHYFAIQAVNSEGESELSYTGPITLSRHWTEPNFNNEMVYINSGTFKMGNSKSHDVTITKPFFIGKNEVTQKLWNQVMEEENPWPSDGPKESIGLGDSYPAYNISWNDITGVNGFLDRLNKKVGCDTSLFEHGPRRYLPKNVPESCFRLPTEAEWEYAAGADTAVNYFSNHSGNFNHIEDFVWRSQTHTNPIGSQNANAWGIYDMFGNVTEWTYDVFTELKNITTLQVDPSGPNMIGYVAVRGGNWESPLVEYSRYHRTPYNTSWRSPIVGFRLVFTSKNGWSNQLPEVPKNFKAINKDSKVYLTWDEDVSVTSYIVSYSTNPIASDSDNFVISNTNHVLISDLQNEVPYYFRVKSVNLFTDVDKIPNDRKIGESNNSESLLVIPTLLKPPPPKNLTSYLNGQQLTLVWDPSFHADKYTVYYSQSDDVSMESTAIETSLANVVIDSLESGVRYYFKVSAHNSKGSGELSTSFTAKMFSHWIDPNTGIEFIKIPAGNFTMGAPESYISAEHHERAQHKVTISKSFYISKFEVTQGLWESTMHSWPGPQPLRASKGPNFPASGMHWKHITGNNQFLDRLNAQIGCNPYSYTKEYPKYSPQSTPSGCYRLPTEAEWEYVAKAGTDKMYTNPPDSELSEYAVFSISKPAKEVGTKLPNPWGIYDLHGNVAEWVFDQIWLKGYSSLDQTDPFQVNNGIVNIIRGGSSYHHQFEMRTTYRSAYSSDHYSRLIGFRLVKVP